MPRRVGAAAKPAQLKVRAKKRRLTLSVGARPRASCRPSSCRRGKTIAKKRITRGRRRHREADAEAEARGKVQARVTVTLADGSATTLQRRLSLR